MIRRIAQHFPHLIGVCLIAALACLLYVPFLGNPLVFDDMPLFSGEGFSNFGMLPFGFDLRHLPYFSLAFTQIVWGQFPPWGHPEIHRVLSLAFHLACSLALYKLLCDLLSAARAMPDAPSPDEARINVNALAFVGAAVFAIHPVTVYGEAYLIQRTIVFATLFSLLSLIYFVRGLSRGSHADAISAALFYTLAVLSKEHSVLLPAVAVLAVPLVGSERRFAARHTALYLAACAPAAIFVTLLSKGVIGDAYEPSFRMVADQLEGVFGFDISDFPWSLSAVTQAGLFFKYLALWLWPDTRSMSIDFRVNFIETWSPGWTLLKVSAFVACGTFGFLLLRRRGRAGLVGFGLLYTWVLFLVEFTAARFQEPFVLYRSYLWAPGIMIMLVALLSGVSRRTALAAFMFVCPVLLYQARDRLVTFSSPLILWKDAVAKLPEKPIPWGSRTLYNLGREYLYSGHPDKAIETAERCLAQYPNTYHCHFARGAIHLELGEFDQALRHLTRALGLRPEGGLARHLGFIFENRGRLEEAKMFYRRAAELGYKAADNRISRLDAPDGGLPQPKKAITVR